MFHIAGVIPFTTIDFPDNLAGVIFFKGCPLKCPFCHNPALQELSEGDETWENVCAFFKERVRRLDGVVLSGGEPLMQPDIFQAVPDGLLRKSTDWQDTNQRCLPPWSYEDCRCILDYHICSNHNGD